MGLRDVALAGPWAWILAGTTATGVVVALAVTLWAVKSRHAWSSRRIRLTAGIVTALVALSEVIWWVGVRDGYTRVADALTASPPDAKVGFTVLGGLITQYTMKVWGVGALAVQLLFATVALVAVLSRGSRVAKLLREPVAAAGLFLLVLCATVRPYAIGDLFPRAASMPAPPAQPDAKWVIVLGAIVVFSVCAWAARRATRRGWVAPPALVVAALGWATLGGLALTLTRGHRDDSRHPPSIAMPSTPNDRELPVTDPCGTFEEGPLLDFLPDGVRIDGSRLSSPAELETILLHKWELAVQLRALNDAPPIAWVLLVRAPASYSIASMRPWLDAASRSKFTAAYALGVLPERATTHTLGVLETHRLCGARFELAQGESAPEGTWGDSFR